MPVPPPVTRIDMPSIERTVCRMVGGTPQAVEAIRWTRMADGASSNLVRERLSGLSAKFVDGLARVYAVTDCDGALGAAHKALSMAGASAAKGDLLTMGRELQRAALLGCPESWARGAAMALLISRGEGACARLLGGVDQAYGQGADVSSGPSSSAVTRSEE